MDIIFPYTHDLHNGLELRYALRSIDKYLTGHGHVFLIGDMPKWYKGIILEYGDTHGRKEYSIKQKMIVACMDPSISDPFIMWHDDHYLLKPLDVNEILYWYDGPLEDCLKRNAKGYGVTLRRTIDTLTQQERGTLNYDIHTPITFDKQKFLSIQNWQPEHCIKSMYANGIAGTQMDDLKINAVLTTEQIRAKIAGRLFFSSGPISLVGEMLEVFQELYPHASRWEK